MSAQAVCADPRRIEDVQRHLLERGVELTWPEGLCLDDGDPHAHAR
jgi:hypothetical protein